MKTKKIIALLLALAMAFALVSCGSGASSSAPAESTPPAASAAASGSEEAEAPAEAPAEGSTQEVVPNYVGTLIPTFTKRTGDSYTIGLYVKGNEIVNDYSYLADYATVGEDGVTVSDLSIDAQGSGFSAIVLQGAEGDTGSTVNLNNVDITLADDEDGTNVSDFTGLGTAIVASGTSETDHNRVNIDGLNMVTTGFERDGIIVDDYADAIVSNSNIVVNGANPLDGKDAYDGYLSTANQAYMLSPPWVLGITGGARAANVLGDYSSLTVVDSTVEAGAWAVLSTDDCTQPTINVINSELKIANEGTEFGIPGGSELFGYATPYGTGYGTYDIGEANEYFYGTTFTDVTYATIMTGTGEIYYGASSDGMTVKDGLGNDLYTYSGEGKDTVVNGVWGVMDHQGGTATLDAGSVWNTEEAVILKKGTNESSYTISGAEVNPASGIIFQMMDDDDGYGTSGAGGDTEALTYDGQAWGMPTFSGGWYEVAGEAGLPSAVGTLAQGGSVTSTLTLSDAEYEGDVLNAAGSGADKAGSGLAVTLSGASLSGAISSTEAVHGIPYTAEAVAYLDNLAQTYGDGVAIQGGSDGANGDGTYTVKYALLDAEGNVTEDEAQAAYIQFMEFTVNEYYMLGHMVNFANAGATVEVSLTDNATWNVTKDSYVTYLNIAEGSSVVVAEGATLYVNGEALTGEIAAGEYGAVAPEAEAGGEGMPGGPGGPEGMPGGPEGGMPGGPGGDMPAEGGAEETPAEPTLDTSHTVQLTVNAK